MAVDFSVFSRLKTKSDYDRENEEFQLKRQLINAEVRKAGQVDVDKMGEQAFLKAAQGMPLSPQEEAAARFLDAKSGGTTFNPVTGEAMQRPRISDKIGLPEGFSGLARPNSESPQIQYSDNVTAPAIPVEIGRVAMDIPGMQNPDINQLEGIMGNKAQPLDDFDSAMQQELAAVPNNPRAQQEIRMKFAGARVDQIKKRNAPLPSTVVKEQNSLMEDVATSSNINADLGSLVDGINSGSIQLGLLKNPINKARNFLGTSTPESRNASITLGSLKKLRNDSLKLNKGTQTDSDAQREWQSILPDGDAAESLPNDANVLRVTLERIAEYNQRAAAEKQMIIDQMRSEYGKDPLDAAGAGNTRSTTKLEPITKYEKDDLGFRLRKTGATAQEIEEYKKLRGY